MILQGSDSLQNTVRTRGLIDGEIAAEHAAVNPKLLEGEEVPRPKLFSHLHRTGRCRSGLKAKT